MKYSAVIIEDELPARVTLKSYLRRYFDGIEVIAELDTVAASIEYLKNETPDILFLDVQLKDGKSIQVLDAIDSTKLRIVFTTAHEEYALEAFHHKSFGYLLKPLDPTDFQEILNRVISDLQPKEEKLYQRRIKIPIAMGNRWIEIKNIIRCEAESNYTKIIVRNDTTIYTLSKTLKHIEHEVINSDQFFRVHQSHLVNLSQIKDMKVQNMEIKMVNGDTVPLSRAKRSGFYSRLEG